MKTLEEVKAFYTNELAADLKALDQQRRRVVTNIMIAAAVIAVLALIGFLAVASQGGPPQIIFFFAIGGVIIVAIIFQFTTKDFKYTFKTAIVGKLVRFLEPQLSYHPIGYIDKHTFRASQLFKHRIDRYKGEDLVRGNVGRTEIVFSELHAEYKTGSGKDTHWNTIFKGLFFIADFNKNFMGQTIVLPDTAEKCFGGFGKMLQEWNIGRPDLVKLEDPEFEREFVVYGNDQIESRYILSTSLMRRILDFKNKTGTKIYLSFVGSKVFVALPSTRNMFEPKYLSDLDDFGPILDYYRDLSLPIGIVDDLNLNTRIWSKT